MNPNFFPLLLLACAATSCTPPPSAYTYSEVKAEHISDFDPGYRKYCEMDLRGNFEANAVLCSFYGDHETALEQETKRHENSPADIVIDGPINDAAPTGEFMAKLDAALQDPETDEAEKVLLQGVLDMMNRPEPEAIFEQAEPVPAIGIITEMAKAHHFTLVNEAHFNAEHRAFTHALLQPLWDIGYRYLALETLGYLDTALHQRGYPLKDTGYFTQEPHFANMVRAALDIGYQLITYETKGGYSGTPRERDQAQHIYQQTWAKDSTGKVLVHAGYDHIFETAADNFDPMGSQLKALVGQDILTVDQVIMMNYTNSEKRHPYRRAASARFDIKEPTVFLNEQGEPILDPIKAMGTDLQVHHPVPRFDQGRPDWMPRDGHRAVPLSRELLHYKEHLVRAMREGEPAEAVPIDQFVIAEGRAFWLQPGRYRLEVVDCEGDLVATAGLQVE